MLAIILMVMDQCWQSFAPIRAAMSLPLVPIQYLLDRPLDLLNRLQSLLHSQDQLIKENLRLKSQRLLLRSRLQRLHLLESENTYLRALMQSSRQVKTKMLVAELLATNTAPYVRKVWLKGGSHEGVYVGQPVLDANGVMGQVTQVGPLTSQILLINDLHSGIAVQNVRNGLRAIVMGDHRADRLRLMYVPKTEDVRIGDIFVTSGLGGNYPEGYPVGRVVMVAKYPAEQFSTVYLQPSAHLYRSRQVLLVWSEPHHLLPGVIKAG